MSVIDFHTHVLPEMDDGSKSVDESIEMLRTLAAQNVTHVIATPHFYANHESPSRFLARREKCANKLNEALMRTDERLPQVSVGAEVYFFEGISDCEFLREMAIEGTDCVLVEMPMKQWSDRNLSELTGIRQKQKLIPIIAHMDRYISPFNTHKIPERLAELPVIVQANASFFTKRFTKRLALNLIAHNKIHLLGSDCHNLTDRAPNIGAALEIIKRELGVNVINRINNIEQKLITERVR